MDKHYDPKAIETHCYQTWEQAGYFVPNGQGDAFCIMIPPPNVTGTLHMGHGFQHTLMDVLTRYKRMQGYNTLWQVGTDHAGIATQMVVERQLQQQNTDKHQLGREAFVKKIWEWKEHSGNTITQQMRRLGNSVDWQHERFTIDDDYTQAVQDVFIKLYDDGLIYRGKRLANWDPVLQTAISDLEVQSEEEQGSLWHIRYPIVGEKTCVTVATTRPETMLGDVAIAVNPNDERYQSLIGKQVQLPLTDRQIPIIADDYVEPEFGTGCVKITPAHDFNDFAVGQRHQLTPINILTPTAHINTNAPKVYQGMERLAARNKIIADLKAAGLLDKTEPHKLTIPRGDRSGAIIEPYLTDQWFVKTAPLAKPSIEVVKQGKIKFVPENWSKIYFQWLENIEDWCISRQLWWGHRIPAWYDSDTNIYVGQDEADVRKKYKLSSDITLHQDEDVLDTWFSSALWPFATLGWPEHTPRLKTYFPTDVLVTGFDIIFFWVARMVMMSLYFTNEVPFKEIYITGLIRDHEGHKMSKSKGNVLDPIDLIDGIDLEALVNKRVKGLMQPEKAQSIEANTRKEFPQGIPAFGTDALRFTFCALATTGRDIRFDLGRIEGYKNFCNKIWNATRFVLMNCEHQDLGNNDSARELSLADRWIISELQHTIQQTCTHLDHYRFDLATQSIYEFIWGKYCDWYLELAKTTLYDKQASEKHLCGTRHTLINVLESILRLIHPFMPFVTEEIWQRVAPLTGNSGKTIMLQNYPQYDETAIDEKALADTQWLIQLVDVIRNIRGEIGVSPGKTIELIVNRGHSSDRERITHYQNYLQTLVKVTNISWLNNEADIPEAATGILGDLDIIIPLAGLINIEEEINRLKKQLEKLAKDIAKIEVKLNNPNYVNKAPAAVVDKDKQRFAELQSIYSKTEQRISALAP